MKQDFKLSPHFSFYELTKTSYLTLQEENRLLTPFGVYKLFLLADLLEKVREVHEAPLIVTNGYRCPKLNKMVGGHPTSQHLLCEAADIFLVGATSEEDFMDIVDWAKKTPVNFGQLIYETSGKKKWIHLSMGEPWRSKKKARQVLIMKDGVYTDA